MVVGLLGEEADPHDERDRVGERRALERLHDLVALARPARERGQGGLTSASERTSHHAPFNRSDGPWATLAGCRSISPTPKRRPRSSSTATSGLTLQWADGSTAQFDLDELRRNCPCAECRGVREQGRSPDRADAPEPLTAVDAELVGGWGLSIRWSDGHETGIYAWSILRAWSD